MSKGSLLLSELPEDYLISDIIGDVSRHAEQAENERLGACRLFVSWCEYSFTRAPALILRRYYCGDTGKSRAVVKRTHKEERAVVVNEPTCEQ